jgi:hypothetical protein
LERASFSDSDAEKAPLAFPSLNTANAQNGAQGGERLCTAFEPR